MKKLVRLISVLMVIAMAMSLVSVSASAIVPGSGEGNFVIAGNGYSVNNGSNAGGNGTIVIGGEDRPSDDSAYSGAGFAPGYDEIESDDEEDKALLPHFTVPEPPVLSLDSDEEDNEQSQSSQEPGEVDVYSADAYELVRENADYIVNLRARIDNGTASEDEINTARMLFGEDVIDGISAAGPIDEKYADVQAGEDVPAVEDMPVVEDPSTPAYEGDSVSGEAAYNEWHDMYADVLVKFESATGEYYTNYLMWNDDVICDDDPDNDIDGNLWVIIPKNPEDIAPENQAAYDELCSGITSVNAYYNEHKNDIYAYLTQPADPNGDYGIGLMAAAAPVTTTAQFDQVMPGYYSLAQALTFLNTLNFQKTFDICNSSSYKITVDLQLRTINSPNGGTEPAFDIRVPTNAAAIAAGNKGSITFTRGTINGEGFAVECGAVLNLGGLYNTTYLPDITVNAGIGNAVYVNGGTLVVAEGATLNGPSVTTYAATGTIYAKNCPDGHGSTVYINGGKVNGSDREAIHAVGSSVVNVTHDASEIKAPNYSAIILEDQTVANVSAGTIMGKSGIALAQGGTLNMTGGRVFGQGGANEIFPMTGAAVLGYYGKDESGNPKDTPSINIAGGELYSYNTNAIICTTSDTAVQANRIKKAKLSDENIIRQENPVGSTKSDYVVATVLVNGVGFANLKAAIEAINNGYDDGKPTLTITMLTDYPSNEALDYADSSDGVITFTGSAKPVVVDGNGHEIKVDGIDGFEVDAGNITIKNVTFRSKNTSGSNDAIYVTGGSAYIGGSVSVEGFGGAGVHNTAGTVTVNDLMVDKYSQYGLYAEGTSGKMTVVMCKIDSDIPVSVDSLSRENLQINGGWFAKDKGAAGEDIATYIDKSVSEVKYVKADKYYEVHLIDTPVIEAKATGTDSSGKPYIIVNKGNGKLDPVVFNVSPEIESIYAVPYNKNESPIDIAAANKGHKGELKIEDKILQKLPAGMYDLEFTFLNSGYVVKDKISLVVYPSTAVMYSETNFKNNNMNAYTQFTNYNVNAPENIAVIVSELPNAMAIGNDAEGLKVTELYNYQKNNSQTWTQITSGPYAGCWVYYVSYADINNLTPGQNYVYVQYGDITGNLEDVATLPLPFTMNNPNVYIIPSSLSWSKIRDYATFTCFPEPQEVYIDGYKVDHGYWDYNAVAAVTGNTSDLGQLRIKSSYLATIPAGDHELTVVTNSGKLAASIHTGAGIAPKDIDYHVYGGSRSLTFVASDDINYDLGITIGSTNAVNVDSFIIRNNNREFTLSANYLNRLALGTYTISAYVKTLDANGNEVYQKCSTTFRVISASEAAYNPGTGDNFNAGLWIAILALSAVVIAAIAIPYVKKSKAAKASTAPADKQ